MLKTILVLQIKGFNKDLTLSDFEGDFDLLDQYLHSAIATGFFDESQISGAYRMEITTEEDEQIMVIVNAYSNSSGKDVTVGSLIQIKPALCSRIIERRA